MSVRKVVSVVLEATHAAFSAAVHSAEGALDHFSDKVGESSMKLLDMVGAVYTAEKALEQLKGAFEEMGQIGRDAEKMGVTVEEMSRLRFAADATHTSIEGLETGFNKMLLAVQKADEGDKKLTALFDKLKLNTRQLQSENPKEAFQEISTAISHMENAAERATAIREIFGKGGGELAPLLKEGGNLGKLFDESDASGYTQTKEAIESVEKAERSLAMATDAWKGSLMDLVTQVAPGIQSLGQRFRELIQYTGSGGRFNKDQAELNEIMERTPGLVKAANDSWKTFMSDRANGEAGQKAISDQKALLDNEKERLATQKRASADLGAYISSHSDANLTGPKATAEQRAKLRELQTEIHATEAIVKQYELVLKALGLQAPKTFGSAWTEGVKKTTEATDKLLGSIYESSETIGMSAGQVKLLELSYMGVAPEIYEAAEMEVLFRDAADGSAKAMEKHNQQLQRAIGSYDKLANGGPLDEYKKQLKDIDMLLKDGIITDEEAVAAAFKGRDEMNKKLDKKSRHEDQHSAAEAVNRVFMVHSNSDPVVEIGKQQLAEQKKTNQHLSKRGNGNRTKDI